MNLKQQFKDLLKKIKKESGHSYKEVAQNSGVKIEVLKNAGAPSGRYFKVTQEDYNALKNAYAKKEEPKPTTIDVGKELQEIKGMVKESYDRIMNKGKDVATPVIAALSKETGQSEEDLMNLLKEILMEKINEKNNKKKE